MSSLSGDYCAVERRFLVPEDTENEQVMQKRDVVTGTAFVSSINDAKWWFLYR